MKVPFVDLPLQWQSLKAEVMPAIEDILERAAFIGGSAVQSFEREFADWLGVGHCVGVGNGTDALYLALRALGIGDGDEVITVANSFIASSEAISLTGAKVVFVDCEPETYTMDVAALHDSLTPRTKAIIPVHLYGRPAPMDAIMAFAREHGLKIVEDCAQSHGAEWNDRKTGTFGDLACFSFFPGKNLGAFGDAGAVVSNDERLAQRVRMLANHGRLSKYDHEVEGVNSRLDALQAAILSAKLRHLPAWTRKRQDAAALYREKLKDTGLPLPNAPANGTHVYHLFVTRVDDRDRIQKALADDGIATGVHYPIALPNLLAYRSHGFPTNAFPVATGYQDQVLSLPMFPEITPEQIAWVCNRLSRLV